MRLFYFAGFYPLAQYNDMNHGLITLMRPRLVWEPKKPLLKMFRFDLRNV